MSLEGTHGKTLFKLVAGAMSVRGQCREEVYSVHLGTRINIYTKFICANLCALVVLHSVCAEAFSPSVSVFPTLPPNRHCPRHEFKGSEVVSFSIDLGSGR